MKKIILTSITSILVLSLIIIGCKKSAKSEANINTLHQDVNFVSLVEQTKEIIEQTANKIKAEKLSSDELVKQINIVSGKNISLQNKTICCLFGNDLYAKFLQYNSSFSINWNTIKEKYGSQLTEANIEKECLIYFKERKALLNIRNLNTISTNSYTPFVAGGEVDSPCSWGYYVCIAGAAAAAIICHGSCEGSAIALTAGLGIPACVALCVTIQSAASLACWQSFCDPKV